LGSGEAWFAPPESVIIHKLIFHRESGSEKHLEDIRGMLIGTVVDRGIIAEWVDQLGLAETWSAALGDLGPPTNVPLLAPGAQLSSPILSH
jgi:hypothetical protein